MEERGLRSRLTSLFKRAASSCGQFISIKGKVKIGKSNSLSLASVVLRAHASLLVTNLQLVDPREEQGLDFVE
jgi:hypothetical protein